MWHQKVAGGGVAHVAYEPTGRTLYTLDRGGQLIAWDIATHMGRKLTRVSFSVLGFPTGIYPLASGGRIVVAGRKAVLGWDTINDRQLLWYDRPPCYYFDQVRVTGEGRICFPNESGTEILGWNASTSTAETPRYFPGFTGIRDFDLAPDERAVAVVCHRRPVTLFEWGTGSELRNPVTLADAYNVRFAPDGCTLALIHINPTRVGLWDVATRRPRVENIPCVGTSGLFAFNPVLPVVVGLNPQRELTLFSSETGAPIRSLDFALGRYVQCVAFSPDGLTCAVGGSNKQFAVFDLDL
jgi:WD40 repeat protein